MMTDLSGLQPREFIEIELNILIEPIDSGWAVGSGIYDLNDAIPILAIAKDGWLFKQWIGNDINQTNSASTTVNLFEDRTIIAQFVEDPDYEPDDDGSTPNPNLNGQDYMNNLTFQLTATYALWGNK